MTDQTSVNRILDASDREIGRFVWEGTFAQYLEMVIDDPSTSRLSHALIYDAIQDAGVSQTTSSWPSYGLFKDHIYGLDHVIERIVQYFASSAQRLEIRKRILLLLGPPASGKSTIVDLLKRALERHTRTDAGAVYAIRDCPMQEEPLHLVPESLRPDLWEEHGIHVEGSLCPRCRYVLRTEYKGSIGQMPVSRVVFSEQEALGIGYYVATNPNPMDASLLVGSIDTERLDGLREDVAGKAFRLDGELNVANRGLMEFVEIFKADKHLLTVLLGLAQEQLIKMEKFGSVYADEAVIGHSNEGDFEAFSSDEHSEALRDRIIAVRVPYNLMVHEEVRIHKKLLKTSAVQDIHVAPLTLPVASTLAVQSRLDPPTRQGMSLMDKLYLYDDRIVSGYSSQDAMEMRRENSREGMTGLSPRYVINRLGVAASAERFECLSPLAALDSLWRGLRENVSIRDEEVETRFTQMVVDTVKEYVALAIRDVQKAVAESFERLAERTLESYLNNVSDYCAGAFSAMNRGERSALERDMRELEKLVDVTERNKNDFRREIHRTFTRWKEKGLSYGYATEPRLKHAIERRLLPSHRELEQALSEPRFSKRRSDWEVRRENMASRMVSRYGYCQICADDTLDFALHALRSRPVLRTPKNEGLEWHWPLDPAAKAQRP